MSLPDFTYSSVLPEMLATGTGSVKAALNKVNIQHQNCTNQVQPVNMKLYTYSSFETVTNWKYYTRTRRNSLTRHFERELLVELRLWRNLALVNSSVLSNWASNLQHPERRSWGVSCPESCVTRIGHRLCSQHMKVTLSYPGYLSTLCNIYLVFKQLTQMRFSRSLHDIIILNREQIGRVY